MAPVVSLVVVKVFSQDSVLQRFVKQIIDEDVGTEEIFKVFSQDGEWVHQHFVEQTTKRRHAPAAWRGSDGVVLRREDAQEVHLKPGHYFPRAP